MISENILKSLFIFHNGEHKGFFELMKYASADEKVLNVISKSIKRRDNENETFNLILELHALCSNKSDVDVDVQQLVDKLYDSIGGAYD